MNHKEFEATVVTVSMLGALVIVIISLLPGVVLFGLALAAVVFAFYKAARRDKGNQGQDPAVKDRKDLSVP
ncbi:hypothetical protein IPM19_01855 [bacterium]|nr:MAG: hypothetical protein IPM19_01855 [bacterium]